MSFASQFRSCASVSGTLLFFKDIYPGLAFAYYVVFPISFSFLSTVGLESVTVMTDINRYLQFIVKLFFAFGVAFEVPLAIVVLVWSGISTVESLSKKRPNVIVGCLVIVMLLTPADVVS